jgi:hypothetical protein
MSAEGFAHLHVHSHYSLLEAVPKLDALIEAAKADGQTALALTDHGNMYGSMPIAANTGYLFNNKLFHPGDAFTIPNTPIEILAFPLTAPWSNIGQTMEYLGRELLFQKRFQCWL